MSARRPVFAWRSRSAGFRHWYEVLGVAPEASPSAVLLAYVARARELDRASAGAAAWRDLSFALTAAAWVHADAAASPSCSPSQGREEDHAEKKKNQK